MRVNVVRVPTPPTLQLVAPVSASVGDVQSSIFKIREEEHLRFTLFMLPALGHLIQCKARCLSRVSPHYHHHHRESFV